MPVCSLAQSMRTDYVKGDEMGHVLALLMPQNALICEVALHTGLRIGDVLALRTAQLKRQFYITEAKTQKRRRVNLPEALLVRIRAQAGEPWAFPGRKPGRPKTRQAVWADVKRAARALRVPANIAPHSLRKRYAVELYHDTGSLEAVQRALNHDRPLVTMLYALADTLRTAGGVSGSQPR